MRLSISRSSWFRGLAPSIVLALGVGHGAAGCATDAGTSPAGDDFSITCSGKCDGLSNIPSAWRNRQDIDLGDLLHVGAGFATDELNHALHYQDLSASVSGPQIYALPAVAHDDLTINNIDELVSGLATNLGEHELTTEVNRLRENHLQTSSDQVFAEAGFKIDAGYAHNWNLNNLGGFKNANATVGFDVGTEVSGRVISAFGNEYKSYASPLEAAMALRGFIMPRSYDDVRGMKPGELVALHGQGVLGFNFGAGVPILIAQPVSAVTYNLVLSAAAATQVRGDLDVQLVRLSDAPDNNQAVVDVGISRGALYSFQIALKDAWGVSGLAQTSLKVGPVNLDLGKLLDSALQSQLNRYLHLVSAEYDYSHRDGRLSVARLRFDLNNASPEVTQAFAQAMRGDVRLAQALGARPGSGVTVDFDLSRSGASTVSHAGLDILGMRFFTDYMHSEGNAVIQTPGGARSLLFDSLRRESGAFFSSHGFNRVGISGLVFDDTSASPVRSEANLFVQVMEGRDFFKRDRLIHHLDGLILATAGQSTLDAFVGPANQMDTYVQRACGLLVNPMNPGANMAVRNCATSMPSDSQVLAYKSQASTALEAALSAAGISGQRADLVRQAAALRIAASMTYEIGDIAGPQANVLLDYRLDDSALATLFTHTGSDFAASVNALLLATSIDRNVTGSDLTRAQSELRSNNASDVQAMASLFDQYADRYQRLLAAEQATVAQLGDASLGASAIEVRYPMAGNVPDYANATAQSIGQARAAAAAEFWDAMRNQAKALDDGPYSEQVLGYSVLSMIPANDQDVRFDATVDLSMTVLTTNDAQRAAGWHTITGQFRGPTAATIDGGLFDVSAIAKSLESN